MHGTHRVRRLHWQARAPGAAEAFALRALLRERGDEVQAVLDREFAHFEQAAAPGRTWHLPRLVLNLDATDLTALDATLIDRLRDAVRTALAAAGADGLGSPPSVPGAADTASAAVPPWQGRDDATEAAATLSHYLATGVLHWTLAGLAVERAREVLAAAAADAQDAVLADPARLHAVLPAAALEARVGAFVRWLGLLAPARRRGWLQGAARSQSVPTPLSQRHWLAWVDSEADDRIEAQALTLAWLTVAEQGAPAAAALRAWAAARPLGPPALREAIAASAWPGAAQGAPGAAVGSPAATATAPRQAGESLAGSGTEAESALPVPLAGLVLLHPYLQRLLAGCGLLDASGRAIEPAQLPQACAVLHALACGDAAAAEYELPLVKLLLGSAPDAPLAAAIPRPTAAQVEEVDALLEAVRTHWSALRGTAVAGLRLSFLQRGGLLRRRDGAWQLHLQSESFDLLLGLLPWSIGFVKLPWMAQPLVVEWPLP